MRDMAGQRVHQHLRARLSLVPRVRAEAPRSHQRPLRRDGPPHGGEVMAKVKIRKRDYADLMEEMTRLEEAVGTGRPRVIQFQARNVLVAWQRIEADQAEISRLVQPYVDCDQRPDVTGHFGPGIGNEGAA